MDRYLTGATIKGLREKRGMTQAQLASVLSVSDKTVSKWETGAGYPDITMLEPIAKALHASVAELLSGCAVENANVSANMLRSHFYVCPVCGLSASERGIGQLSPSPCSATFIKCVTIEETRQQRLWHVMSSTCDYMN